MKTVAFLGAALAVLLSARPGHPGGCAGPVSVWHASQTASAGSFVISEMSGRPVGPPIRFWSFGSFGKANNGGQAQFTSGASWLTGAHGHDGASDDQFFLWQANWAGPDVRGCVFDFPEPHRTVVEISYLFEEKKPSHYTGYLIASVGPAADQNFDFDRIANGNLGGAKVKLIPIPAPVPQGTATKNGSNSSFQDVKLTLPSARSYGDAGAPPSLISGYEVYYLNDEVPRTSDPYSYKPVRNPASPSSTLGLIPWGTPSVAVAVPKPKSATYFVTLLVYLDGTARLTSHGTSGSSAPVPPFDGVDEADKSKPKPDASPTPAQASATPDPLDEPGGPTEVAAAERSRATPAAGTPGTTAPGVAAGGGPSTAPATATGSAAAAGSAVVGGGTVVVGAAGASRAAERTAASGAGTKPALPDDAAKAAALDRRSLAGPFALAPGAAAARAEREAGEPPDGGVDADGVMEGSGTDTSGSTATVAALRRPGDEATDGEAGAAGADGTQAVVSGTGGGRDPGDPASPRGFKEGAVPTAGVAGAAAGNAAGKGSGSARTTDPWRILDLAMLGSIGALSYFVWAGRRA